MKEKSRLPLIKGYSCPGDPGLGSSKLLGFVVDNSTPVHVKFVASNPPPLGDYVVVESEPPLLGFVEKVGSRSITLSYLSTYTPDIIEAARAELASDVFFECSARLLGDVDKLRMPRKPPLPGARVYLAEAEILRRIFGGKKPYKIKLGRLAARPEVEVYIDVNSLVTRHTAILAVTGAGKSNTVAVIASSLASIGGTVLILDFHGEYKVASFGGRKNLIEPRINPADLSVSELMALLGIERRFYNQERVLRMAVSNVRKRGNGNFINLLVEELKAIQRKSGRREEVTAANAVINKVETFVEKYGSILDDNASSIVGRIRPGSVNVLDLSQLDRDASDAIVSHVLRVVLAERKAFRVTGRGLLPYPVLIVVEEAHILAPKDDETLSKYWMARIAREGRKFGVGLMLVSQRPKKLDDDILSQANNLIVLRLLEPSDQKYIQQASESLTDDLIAQLPALNTGEAIVVGPFIRLPALVLIDKYPEPLGGSDIDVVAEWRKYLTDVADSSESVAELVSKLF